MACDHTKLIYSCYWGIAITAFDDRILLSNTDLPTYALNNSYNCFDPTTGYILSRSTIEIVSTKKNKGLDNLFHGWLTSKEAPIQELAVYIRWAENLLCFVLCIEAVPLQRFCVWVTSLKRGWPLFKGPVLGGFTVI